MVDWWKKLWRKSPPSGGEPPRASDKPGPSSNEKRSNGKPASEKAKWLAADDPGNPFGVELLDLMVTQTITSTTRDPENAARAISWGRSWGISAGQGLDIVPVLATTPVECRIELPVDRSFPPGLLFAPSSMEQKWVLAFDGARIIAARSWTGAVEAVGDVALEGGKLVVRRVWAVASSPLVALGELSQTFEWLLRSHALGEKLPFPVNDEGASTLEHAPLLGFSAFGDVIFCAARSHRLPPATKPLRSDGRVIFATRSSDLDALARAVEGGDDVDAPGTFHGYTALHVAIVRGETATVEKLLSLGAKVNQRCDGDMFALGLAIVHRAPPELFAVLERAGVELSASNADGFSALHAAAETDNAWAVGWLVERGQRLDVRTERGHTPLQIACALGHLLAAKELVARGANANDSSPEGGALAIASTEGKAEVVAWLRSLA